MKDYPRSLRKGFVPFDPIALVRKTEVIAARGEACKTTAFYSTGVYGGISTGYTGRCCLPSIFCWADFSPDFPETQGKFYAPDQVVGRLAVNARHRLGPRPRISGGGPRLCMCHLLAV